MVLLDNIEGIEDAMRVAERIQTALEPAFLCGEQHVFITASIGISTNDGGVTNTSTILRGADAAMYRAKALGKGRYRDQRSGGQRGCCAYAQAGKRP